MIEYHNRNFDNPIPKIDDDYAGPPTPERDARWRALHYVGDTRLSKSQASRLLNKTAAAQPGSDKDYPIVLTVFHDLHCLVRISFSALPFVSSQLIRLRTQFEIPWAT